MGYRRRGFTLIEIIVVLIIIGLITAFALPNFTSSTEMAKASSAWNNLLAIYSAQQNYNNNNGGNGNYAQAASLQAINTTLSLNIPDDGSYLYSCSQSGTVYSCTATRNLTPVPLTMTVTLNAAVQTNLSNPNPNPTCTSTTGNANWCP